VGGTGGCYTHAQYAVPVININQFNLPMFFIFVLVTSEFSFISDGVSDSSSDTEVVFCLILFPCMACKWTDVFRKECSIKFHQPHLSFSGNFSWHTHDNLELRVLSQ
jgi:hypothetical protein